MIDCLRRRRRCRWVRRRPALVASTKVATDTPIIASVPSRAHRQLQPDVKRLQQTLISSRQQVRQRNDARLQARQ